MGPEEPFAVKTEKQKVKKSASPVVMVLVAIVLLLVGGASAYWWRDKEAKRQSKEQQARIALLEDLVIQATSSEEDKSNDSDTAAITSGPSQMTIDNVKASISSGNTAALTGYMAPNVLVIIAASEGMGMRTPAEATADVTSYIEGATGPWNFDLPTATLNDWGSGDYAQYFPAGAVVGQSANKYVISFEFNNAGKITGIFMAISSDLL